MEFPKKLLKRLIQSDNVASAALKKAREFPVSQNHPPPACGGEKNKRGVVNAKHRRTDTV